MSAKLSVVVPVFNEARTVRRIIERVVALPIEVEVIVVDDGSTDGSGDVLRDLAREFPDTVKVISLPANRGKGAAVRAGLARATGDVLTLQDADIEYDPEDLPRLVAALDEPGVDIAYGSRILGRTPHGHPAFYLGGVMLSLVASLLFRTHVSDEPTCYKVFPRRVLEKIRLTCTGFEFCPEVTAKALHRGFTIRNVPIRYHPRSFKEGKKIRWLDGLKAFFYLLRYRLAG